jgi:hypothetical protein
MRSVGTGAEPWPGPAGVPVRLRSIRSDVMPWACADALLARRASGARCNYTFSFVTELLPA